MTAPVTVTQTWEAFCDHSYYDMWCVRKDCDRTFGQGFHVIRQDEAEALRDLLNTRTAAEAASAGMLAATLEMAEDYHAAHIEQRERAQAADRIEALEAQLAARDAAGLALYKAGKWELNDSDILPHEQAVMWEGLRDALGLQPGYATANVHKGDGAWTRWR